MEDQAENRSNDTNDSREKEDARRQELSSDYGEIASLVAQLDVQVEKFVGSGRIDSLA